MSLLRCPVCLQGLEKHEKSLACENGHSFDISRSGYVNLLLSNSSSDKRHGDDKLMVSARRAFLEKGYYSILSDCINDLLARFCKRDCILADAGCGEGWYTERAAHSVGAREVYGFDISRDAVACAAKRDKTGAYAVASVFNMPLCDGCTDALLSIFAPHSYEEFARILAPGGVLIRVVPLEEHLMELKQAVYENVYPNEPEKPEIPLFTAEESRELRSVITVENEDIKNLFMMTPYYYKTGEHEQQKLRQLQKLTTRIAFRVTLYKKNTAG